MSVLTKFDPWFDYCFNCPLSLVSEIDLTLNSIFQKRNTLHLIRPGKIFKPRTNITSCTQQET